MRVPFSNAKVFVLITGMILIIWSCTTPEQVVVQQNFPEPDGRYDSEFPVRSVSDKLDFVSTTVKKLDCLAFYMTYVFAPENTVDPDHITEVVLREQSISNAVTNESVSATATVIYYDGIKIGLLTCAHVINFTDTIITRYNNGEGPVEIISIKIKQQNFIKDLPAGDEIEILATDAKHDIALLGKKLDIHDGLLSVLNFPVGNTRHLDWGSVVYIMGFPLGKLMVTRALVSNPDGAKKGRFLTDALYNRGISGSPVFAIRDGVPNFELVGMASAASASQVYYVKPGKNVPEYINPEEPFTGDLYVDQHNVVKYGITFNVSIEAITGFLKSNQHMLTQKGFNKERFFK